MLNQNKIEKILAKTMLIVGLTAATAFGGYQFGKYIYKPVKITNLDTISRTPDTLATESANRINCQYFHITEAGDYIPMDEYTLNMQMHKLTQLNSASISQSSK